MVTAMAEYINREVALRICDKEYQERLRMRDYCGDTVAWNIGGEIKSIPAADVAPVRHGRWKEPYDGFHDRTEIVCSCCGRTGQKHFNYCPMCGAKMDGGKGNEAD